MKTIKIQSKDIYPDGQWVRVASEREQDEGKVDDELIYFYLQTDEQVENIKAGDKIMLDEEFFVMEVRE